MAFSIGGSTPSEGQRPTYPASEGVVYPPSSGMDGNGNPIGAVGKPEARLGRNYITATNLQWWMNHFSSDTDLSVAVSTIVVFNELSNQEETYSSGIMHRPTWDRSRSVAGVYYRDLRIRISELEA